VQSARKDRPLPPDLAPATEKLPAAALPATEAAALDWLRLTRSRRVGPATFIRLLREFGSATAALDALPRIAAEAGASGYAPASRAEAEAEWAAAETAGARPLLLGTPGYPPLLALLSDPPPLLWALGNPAIAARTPFALVGARNASALGLRMATRLARDLGAAGHATASGLARGIDAAAHTASLSTGTVAVLAGGVDVVYPPENATLADAIAESGLRLSEMPMGTPPKAQHFLRRNRIVSGLALATVVVEAAERSGAINTARNALDQGREVLAVPGHPLDPRAGGCNLLIRDGATLVRSAADILDAVAGQITLPLTPKAADNETRGTRARQPGPVLSPQPADPRAADADGADTAEADATLLAARLLGLLGPVPVPEDVVIREAGRSPAMVAAALLDLELAGAIARHPGGLLSRPT
jgi:DNA processing protein